MATEAPKRRAHFDDLDDGANKRHRSGDEDRAKPNGASTSSKKLDRDHTHNNSKIEGKAAYKDPFGGKDRLDKQSEGTKDTQRSKRRNPNGAGRERDGRSSSPVRRGKEEHTGPRQRSPNRGPRHARSPGRKRPDEKPARDRDGSNAKPSDKSGAAASTIKNTRQANDDGSTPMAIDIVEDEEEAQMRRMMGFARFRTTKNTKVPGNDKNYGVRKEKKIEYRQYMNRTGGFNRPLSPG